MFFEGGGYKSRAVCHGARTVHIYIKEFSHAILKNNVSIPYDGNFYHFTVPYAHHGKPLSIYNRHPQKTC